MPAAGAADTITGRGALRPAFCGDIMLTTGQTMFLLIPSATNQRVLHEGKVIESSATNFVAKFTSLPLPPVVGADFNAFCELRGKFYQQGTRVTEVRSVGDSASVLPTVVVFDRVGQPISAESRGVYRVSTVTAGIIAQLGDERNCPVVDLSGEGFAIVARGTYNLGSIVPVVLAYETSIIPCQARVQTMRKRPDGKLRYGFLAPQNERETRKKLQQLSIAIQRVQLQRLAGST